jgi:hypothetical protein
MEGKFIMKTTIYVSTTSALNFEQTQSVTNELLRILGYPDDYAGLTFQFINAGNLIQANASVDKELRVSVNN